jgi:hypothetical protein
LLQLKHRDLHSQTKGVVWNVLHLMEQEAEQALEESCFKQDSSKCITPSSELFRTEHGSFTTILKAQERTEAVLCKV